METSRVNLAALAVGLVAGLLVLHLPESQGILASIAGLTLLISLLAFGRESSRTGTQSLGFAMVCGLAALGIFAFPLRFVLGTGRTVFGQDALPPAFWLLASAIFWFVDRSGADSGAPQPVSFSGAYTKPAPTVVAPSAAEPKAQAFAATVAQSPNVAADATVFAPLVQPIPPPPAPTTGSTPAAAAPPVLSGKEVSIYVTMMGEGMNVLRTVRAEHLGRDFYVIKDEMPADEAWEFLPGQVVRCKKKNLSNGKGLVAFEEAPRTQQT
jgi:hypothetical protein